MVSLSPTEQSLGEMAAATVEAAGGSVAFDEYDRLMAPKRYFTPISWIDGWGLPPSFKKANADKLCAFAAVQMGLLEQTAEGYVLLRGIDVRNVN